VGAHAQKRMSDADLLAMENNACPGADACGGQFTANTMAMVCEFLGLSPMGSASVPALDARKPEVAQVAAVGSGGRRHELEALAPRREWTVRSRSPSRSSW
jgi:dihydroxyacid dehydratase/phosphogluconate dehydratase